MAMIYETNSLQHFGIKGQKWGLRRFQEEDGTLTEAGKARYGKSSEYEKAAQNHLKKTGGERKGRHAKAIRDIDELLNSKDERIRKLFSDEDRSRLKEQRDKWEKQDAEAAAARNKERGKKLLGIAKKAAVGLGTAALVGAAAKAYKKSTDLRDEMRDKAGKEALGERALKRAYIFTSKAKLNESLGARDHRRAHPGDVHNRSLMYDPAFHQSWAKEAFKVAKRHGDLEKKYTDIARNATRRQAVKNYLKHKGTIVI